MSPRLRSSAERFRRFREVWLAWLLLCCSCSGADPADPFRLVEPGLWYKNFRLRDGPFSIHVVRITRTNKTFSLHSVHAGGRALGLGSLPEQVQRFDSTFGIPVAAINGEFYKRNGAYAGDSRGLQIANGELMSGPTGGAVFWLDPGGNPVATNVSRGFRVTWPDGTSSGFGLNEERSSGEIILFTPSAGRSTQTRGGMEFVLERPPASDRTNSWLALPIGEAFKTRVREVRMAGNSPLAADTLVLSVGAGLAPKFADVKAGALLTLSTITSPNLKGVRTAIGGGPVLLRDGRRVRIPRSDSESFEFSSMTERHPRSAIGWNDDFFFLIEVDGRQRASVGQTLDELAAFARSLGCLGAMNLDGGGSATLWVKGEVVNEPCDGQPRAIANALIVARGKAVSPKPSAIPDAGSK